MTCTFPINISKYYVNPLYVIFTDEAVRYILLCIISLDYTGFFAYSHMYMCIYIGPGPLENISCYSKNLPRIALLKVL